MTGKREPLFVKVDGYRSILEDLDATRQHLAHLQESLDVLRQLRDVKQETLEVFLGNLDALNDRLENVARELPEVEAANVVEKPDVPEREPRGTTPGTGNAAHDQLIEQSIQDLRNELNRLKNGLDDIQ